MNDSIFYDSYLALIPRGLQHAARDTLTEQLSGYHVLLEIVGESVTDESSPSHVIDLLRKQRTKGRNKNSDIDVCFGDFLVGSVSENKRDFSIGYMQRSKPVWACPGVIHGVAWLKIETNAPAGLIAKHVRCLGPIIALTNVWDRIDMPASQSLEEAVGSVKAFVESVDYTRKFLAAKNLWRSHVHAAWNLSEDDSKTLNDKVGGKAAMKYRLSCIRSDSEKYQYTRQNFLASVADIVVPHQEFSGEAWKVDLTSYDLEVVLLVHPKALAVGISLRPYQHLGVRSFATGAIPPDVTAPVLSGEVLASLIRLKPTTAQLLLQLARIEPGDVILDPCAGVGTIPIEVLFQRKDAVALGGDIALTEGGLGAIAADYSKKAHSLKQGLYPSSARCADHMAWDATCLPLRDASADVVVSDLPFGVHCLSKAKLGSVLPLMFSEVARVLRPQTGRVVLLCGNYVPVVRALHQLNTGMDASTAPEDIISMPCDSVFPVNIGGLLAWIVIAKRGAGQTKQLPGYKERVRRVTCKRERIERCRSNEKAIKKRGALQS